MNLLINPACMNFNRCTPAPLALLHMAAMDANTRIHDEAIRPAADLNRLRPKVVGVPVYTRHRHASLDRLRRAKESGAITVAGGPHVSIMAKQMAAHYDFIDYLVVGDGELAWKAICAGESMPRIISMRVENLDDLPLPAWELIDYRQHSAHGRGIHRGNDLTKIPRTSVLMGRGCTGACTFCSAWWVNGKPRMHGKEWMRRHLTLLWEMGVRHLVFWDDSLTQDRRATLGLCDILDEFAFSWTGTARADEVDEEMAQRLADSGCYLLAFGIESGSQAMLDKMNKKTTVAAAFVAREACRKAGIHFKALMMTNFPGSTAATDAEDKAFRDTLRPDSWGTSTDTFVFPGTALYQRCKKRGLIDDDFWLGPKPYFICPGGQCG